MGVGMHNSSVITPFDLNTAPPSIMHIDLNSCFATIEQQSRPSLRGRPVGVTNRITPHCCMIALSYEAKRVGAKVGMRHDEVRGMVPNLIVLETDPPKYHHAYQKLVEIMKSYSPKVKMKSIDEGIIDFSGSNHALNMRSHNSTKALEQIGYEIKQRLKEELGCWMKCNVGIAPNRFLAKLAAGFNKPDGLTVIDHRNIEEIYSKLVLQDFPGIASRFEKRLKEKGVTTPLEFLHAPYMTLRKGVFKSIVGEHWYKRIRGYEVDDVETNLGIVGKQFVMDNKTTDEREIKKRFSYLCYSTGRKLRYNEVAARGIYVYLQLANGESWFKRHLFERPFHSDKDVFANAMFILDQREKTIPITMMSITCYHLSPLNGVDTQLELFKDIEQEENLTETIDDINDYFGLPSISFATSLGGHNIVKQKIPFGSTKYFELLCKRA